MAKNYKRKLKRRKSLAELKRMEVVSDEENTISDEDGDFTYDLVSYLVHKGASAVGGFFSSSTIDHFQDISLLTSTMRSILIFFF